MNKSQLVDYIADQVDCTKADAERMIKAFTEAVTDTLVKGETVALTGFGTFGITHRKARDARNPRTGEKIHVPAMNSPKFKAGKKLKDAVRRR